MSGGDRLAGLLFLGLTEPPAEILPGGDVGLSLGHGRVHGGGLTGTGERSEVDTGRERCLLLFLGDPLLLLLLAVGMGRAWQQWLVARLNRLLLMLLLLLLLPINVNITEAHRIWITIECSSGVPGELL